MGTCLSFAAGCLGALSALAHPATAQNTPPLQKGMRVRIVLPASDGRPDHYVSGSLIRLDNDTVTINAAGGLAAPQLVTYGLDGGRQLQWVASSHGHAGKGAWIGALFGGLAGGVAGAAASQPCSGFCVMDDAGYAAAGGAIVGAAAGALVGMIIGGSSRTEHWVPLQTEGIRVSIGPETVRVSAALR